MRRTLIILGLSLSCSLFAITLAQGNRNECTTTESGSPGYCIPVRDCKRLYTMYTRERPVPESTKQLLKAEECGRVNRVIQVCCRDESATTTQPPTVVAPDVPTTPVNNDLDVSAHRNVHLVNPDTCGRGSSGRIINGDDTGVFEMPWMVLLNYRSKSGRKFTERFQCGGALINSRYILTAAHCIKNSTYHRLVSVRLGEHDTSTDPDCEESDGDPVCAPPPQNINVESFVRHPGYSSITLKDDIALVRLAQPADTSKSTIRPICLPVGPAEQNKNLDPMTFTIAGWGKTEYDNQSSKLLKASVPIVPTAECHAVLQPYGYNINEHQLCAGVTDKKQDSCNGDSGGPLVSVVRVRSEGCAVQYGIVSYGSSHCGTVGFPGVYTRVGPYMKWILDTIKP